MDTQIAEDAEGTRTLGLSCSGSHIQVVGIIIAAALSDPSQDEGFFSGRMVDWGVTDR
jgi:hypothetical protein